jgi:hypothetical protein
VLSQNAINYQFALNNTQPNLVRLLSNAIVEFKIRGVNANGVSNIPAVLEAMYREHYDHSKFESEKIDGESGFKVTIPDALKLTKYGTASGYVFETEWGVEVRKKGVTAFDAERIIPANGNNFFEIEDLEPDTLYEIRVRGRYILNDAANTVQLAFPQQLFEVETGNEQTTPLTNPTLSDISRPLPFQNPESTTQTNNILMSFRLTNTDPRQVKIHYAVNTQAEYTVTTNDEDTLGTLSQNGFALITNIVVASGSTVYIHYRAFPAPGVTADPSTDLRSSAQIIPALVTGTFFHNSSVYATRTNYAPFNISEAAVPLPSGTVAWNPTLPRTISSNTNFTSVAPQPTTVIATFNSNSGTPTYSSQSGSSPLSVSNPGSPTRSGFTFDGWSPAVPTTITSNTTFVAQWLADTSNNPPNAPTNLTFTNNGGGSVTINWTHDGQNVQGFFAQWGVGSTTNYNLGSINLGSAARSHTVTGLSTNQPFYFRVSAGNVDGDSAFLSGSIFLAF